MDCGGHETPEDRFDAFYRAEQPRLAAAQRLSCGDAQLASDVSQEAFARAWARWRRVERLDRPAGWLYRTAFRQLFRSLSRPRAQLLQTEPVAAGPTDRLDLEAALRTLPVRQRQAVVLRHALGWSGAETAAALGLSEPAARALLHRGIESLRQHPSLKEVDR